MHRMNRFVAFAIGLALIIGVWIFYSKRTTPALVIPIPRNLTELDPQLRAYLLEKISWVRERPKDPERQATLGIVYAANGLWAQALDAFRNVTRLDAKEPLAPMYVAIATQELGDLAEAVKLYRELTIRFPKFAPGYYRLGDASLRAGEVVEAESAFQRLITLAPEEWRGYAGLGDVYLRKGNFAEAGKQLERAVRLAPGEKITRHLLGLAYRGLGQTEDAAIELSRGLNAQHYPMPDPWAANASRHMKLLPDLYAMARDYSESGHPAEAIKILEGVLAFHRDNPGVMIHLAQAYHQANQPQKGVELLLRVIQKDDKNLQAFTTLANSYAAMGDCEKALAFAQRSVELGTNNVEAYLAKANALLACERDSDALASLETAARCNPQDSQIELLMGDICLQNLNRPEEAMDHYRSAVKLDSSFVSAYVRIGQLSIERGDPAEARKVAEIIRKLEPANDTLKLLEDGLRKLEEPKK